MLLEFFIALYLCALTSYLPMWMAQVDSDTCMFYAACVLACLITSRTASEIVKIYTNKEDGPKRVLVAGKSVLCCRKRFYAYMQYTRQSRQ